MNIEKLKNMVTAVEAARIAALEAGYEIQVVPLTGHASVTVKDMPARATRRKSAKKRKLSYAIRKQRAEARKEEVLALIQGADAEEGIAPSTIRTQGRGTARQLGQAVRHLARIGLVRLDREGNKVVRIYPVTTKKKSR